MQLLVQPFHSTISKNKINNTTEFSTSFANANGGKSLIVQEKQSDFIKFGQYLMKR